MVERYCVGTYPFDLRISRGVIAAFSGFACGVFRKCVGSGYVDKLVVLTSVAICDHG